MDCQRYRLPGGANIKVEDRIMKKLGMLGIIGGAALLTAAPLSLQWSQKNVALSLDSAEAQSGPRAIGPPSSLSSPTSCGYLPYGTSYVAPCGYYSSSYAQAYERLQAAATAAPYGYSYAAPYSYYRFSTEGARHTCDRRHRRGC